MEITQAPTNQLTNAKSFLDLLPGKIIDIQFTNPLSFRFKLTLVGYEAGKYLILKYPKQAKLNEYSDILKEGNGAIVRYIVEGERGECVAFSTTILAISVRPEKLIFLAYPKQIESRQLREVNRLQTHIPAKISINKDQSFNSENLLQGIIIDISATGCRFTVHVNSGFLALKKRQVFVHLLSPIDSSAVIISAHVRNNQMQDNRLNVGIEFAEQEREKVQKLLEVYAIDIN
ncbi:flagellar brake protein [Pseudoalteromonas shioyasakiensis]|uniref:flagellar brake domain-containing protein n=1 Tax=Pseudoalteromonas shioyasakiensis TaxID=1190813 RepID=UPI0021182CC5|nr:flagellar brake protein [Pseudoalteromonas shioyasakiensis]MCQ8876968.1 flagellar brake protein [Pseudoalteromonas shioyasakiensis]